VKHLGVWAVGRNRSARGLAAPAMAATGSCAPASLWAELGNKSLGMLWWEVTEAKVCSQDRRGLGRKELAVRRQW
jgi:hypothetical protein